MRVGSAPHLQTVEQYLRRLLRHHKRELHFRPCGSDKESAHRGVVESIEVDLAENHAGCSPTLEPVHRIDKQVAISENGIAE